jgi:hypothetical protein
VGSIDSGTFRDVQQQASQAEQAQAQAQRYASGAFEPPQMRASPAANVPSGVSMVCNSAVRVAPVRLFAHLLAPQPA